MHFKYILMLMLVLMILVFSGCTCKPLVQEKIVFRDKPIEVKIPIHAKLPLPQKLETIICEGTPKDKFLCQLGINYQLLERVELLEEIVEDNNKLSK